MTSVELNGAGFDAAVEQGVTVVDFWATYCGPCKMLGAILEKLGPQFDEMGVRVGKVNIESEPALAARFALQSVPVLMIFKDGMLMTKLEGLQKPADILEAVSGAL